MIDFVWKVFCKTGSIDTYLLMKEMEREFEAEASSAEEYAAEEQPTV
ncbi:YqzL family protein [Tuberibacillus calidus]|jgi:hypothetical protein|nr:YqzL family protein [Tuberibacillus calidus]